MMLNCAIRKGDKNFNSSCYGNHYKQVQPCGSLGDMSLWKKINVFIPRGRSSEMGNML